MFPSVRLLLVSALVSGAMLSQDAVLVEAESFAERGGWKLDTQFIDVMGSPYLLAHGLGRPVADATTTVTLPGPGRYRVFVRTFDWVARWGVEGAPGRFRLRIGGKSLDVEFGTRGRDWSWHDGGAVELPGGEVTLALRDLTGFDGRCDAIYLTRAGDRPPNETEVLSRWRRTRLGLPEEPTDRDGYDLVVVGGGYSGMGAAISAARQGCRVALIQNRPVLGGNGSSEVRVWAKGLIKRGLYPHIGEIIEEFADNAKKSPGTREEFGDARKERVVRAEQTIDLFLNHHAYAVEKSGQRIAAVLAFDTRTSRRSRFRGALFVDCTGHGHLGAWAGADHEIKPDGRMGMSNMWRWAEGEEAVAFPKTPWALPLTMRDFPYPRRHHGEWFWESGYDKDPIKDAEAIRDWNLRAVFGAFNAMKNGEGAKKHENALLTWVAYVGGTRESRRLFGDVVLTEEDIVSKREFPDGCVPSTWSIDLHYPKKQYAKKFPDNPFIAIAKHGTGVDRNFGYPVPYRCFYSRNVPNLFMAGRCISVTHEALGTVRVMKTCGMMGEVVGKAAWICRVKECEPRQVYTKHLELLKELLRLPGKSRRDGLHGELAVPDVPEPGEIACPPGFEKRGILLDDANTRTTGSWQSGDGLKPFFGVGYRYSRGPTPASLRFEFAAESDGQHEIFFAYTAHENRAKEASVFVDVGTGRKRVAVNMQEPPKLPGGFVSLGRYALRKGAKASVTVSCEGADGYVSADALHVVPVR